MGMMKLAIMGFIVIMLLIAIVQPVMIILNYIAPLFPNQIVVGVLMLIGVIVVLSFVWYAGESINV